MATEGGRTRAARSTTQVIEQDVGQRGDLRGLEERPSCQVAKEWRPVPVQRVEKHHPVVRPKKGFAGILLLRMKDAIASRLRAEQAGFRNKHSCMDQITTRRIITEQSTLYISFIDFEKALSTVDRQAILNIKLQDHMALKGNGG